MPVKPTMVTRIIGSVVILRESNDTPTDEEWDGILRILSDNQANLANLKFLVVTDGGGPNHTQRKRLERVLGGRSVRVAVVTDSAKSRFIASAVSLINRDHAGFSTKEIEGAYEHLRMNPLERRQAEVALREMDPLIK